MKIIPKYQQPFSPILYKFPRINFNINYNGNPINGIIYPQAEDENALENIFKQVTDPSDNRKYKWKEFFEPIIIDDQYKFHNILDPNKDFVIGSTGYNPKTGFYGYNNYGHTQADVENLKRNNLAYNWTSDLLYDYQNNDDFRQSYSTQAGKYLELPEGTNIFDTNFSMAPKGGSQNTGNLFRRTNGLNSILSSYSDFKIPHYYYIDNTGKKVYVGYGNNYQIPDGWSKGEVNDNLTDLGNQNQNYKGLYSYDVEIIPDIQNSRFQIGNINLFQPDPDKVEISKRIALSKPNDTKTGVKSDQPKGSWLKRLTESLGLGRKGQSSSDSDGQNNNKLISPAWMQGLRIAVDNAFNTINTENLIQNMDVPLANYTPIYRQVHGDYIAQQQAQREASRLRSSQPVTANQQIQSAVDLEGIEKGNRIIEQGNAKDAQMFWQTSEQAFQQAKENTRGWDAIANQNRQRLAEFNNKIAELRFNTRKQNMQNWDTFATDMEKRAWQKYDLEEYKRIAAQEELDTLYDSRTGVSDKLLQQQTIYDQLEAEEAKTTKDEAKIASLKEQYRKISREIQAQQYYNKLKRLGLYDEQRFRQLFPDFSIQNDPNKPNYGYVTSIPGNKNGGILRRLLQQGGAFGVIAGSSAGGQNPYLAGTAKSGRSSTSTSSSTKKDDDDTKTRDKLLSNIAETIKGIDGLNSDVNTLYRELTNFFDIQKYNPNSDDPMQFYSMYIRALNRVNQVKQSAKQFDNAYKALEKTGSMTSPAIDANGFVYVGVADSKKITKIRPEEYLADPSKYHLLRNNELLELRRNHPEYSFSDNFITETAYNGTSIQEVHKYIKDLLGKVGTDKQSQDMLVRQYGSSAVQGLQTLSQLAQGGLSPAETAAIVGSLNGTLTEMNVTTHSQAEHAKLALNTIQSMLPANMRTLLLLHAGSEQNIERMLVSFVAQGLDSTIDFKVNGITQLDENGIPKSGSTKSGSGSGGNEKEITASTATKWVQGYGAKSTFQITTGTNKGWIVTGNTLPLTDNSDKKLGQATLLEASQAFGGTLDLRHAVMGNSRISSLGLSQVLLEDGDITLVALPLDENSEFKRPAFGRLKSLSDAESELKQLNIDVSKRESLSNEEKKKVNEVYSNHNLPALFNSDGSINKLKFGYFGLIKGIAKETAFEEGSEFTRDYLISATDQERKLFEDSMKAKGQKDFSISDGVFGFGKDNVYRGTIFIPVNTNIFNTQAGYGSTYAGTPSQDISNDTKQQFHDALSDQGGAKPIGKTNFNTQ